MFKNLAAWFTPTRRQLIQTLFASLAIIAVTFGFGTQSAADQWLIITAAVMQFAASLLSLVNIRIGDWSTAGWAIVRAAVYALATVVSPALTLLGFYGEDVNTRIVTGVSLALSSLSSLVAIFASGKQAQVATVVAAVAAVAPVVAAIPPAPPVTPEPAQTPPTSGTPPSAGPGSL